MRARAMPWRDEGGARGIPRESAVLALLLITLLGLILRIYRIGAQSLWVDELLTINQGNQPGHSLWEQFLDDTQSPLPMVAVAWMRAASSSEAWLRLPGALLAAASVPLMYVLGRRIHGVRTGLFAALLLAVNPFHIYHAQEVRGYAYMLFFGMAASAVALAARHRFGRRRAIVVTLLGTATVLCNLQGLFWMAGTALGLLAAGRVRREDLGRFVATFAAIAALTMPWWTSSLQMHESDRLLPGADTGEPLRGATTFSSWALPYAAFVLTVGNTLGPTNREIHEATAQQPDQPVELAHRHVPIAAAVAALCGVMVVGGLVALRRRSVGLLLWAAVPVAVALLLAARNVKPFNARYVIAALPTLLLFMGAGLQRMPRRAAFLLLAGWLAVSGVALARYYFVPAYGKEDVRAAAQLVQSREGRDDLVLAPTIGQVFLYYYRGRCPVRVYLPEGWPGQDSIDEVAADRAHEKRFLWYVRSRAWVDDPSGSLLATLEGQFPRVGRFELPGVEVLLYDRQGGSR